MSKDTAAKDGSGKSGAAKGAAAGRGAANGGPAKSGSAKGAAKSGQAKGAPAKNAPAKGGSGKSGPAKGESAKGEKKSATRTPPSKFPVREGEDPWTKQEVAEVRERLEVDLANSRAEIDAAESEIASRLRDSVGGAGDDPADAGAKTYQREHDLALTYNARDLHAQTQRALERMDSGTYGICEVCGKAIGKARLQAYPRATLCVQDKQREERR